MTNQTTPLSDNEIYYVKQWTELHDIGKSFTFSGWKDYYKDDPKAPRATTIGGQVVAALEATPVDPRLDFIGLAQGPGKGGEVSDKTGANAQYYKRLK